jgi:para-nitrobenzyl esterase
MFCLQRLKPRSRNLESSAFGIFRTISFIGLLIATATLPMATVAQNLTVVETKSGPVKGLQEGGNRKFLGIPYAKPPLGGLRWANPVAPDAWTEVRDATKFGKTCAQIKELGDFADSSIEEDCLYLNVYAPEQAQNRPVMFWIHGGESTGRSNDYDGSALAKEHNVIVVTINYRLGALGDLIHPALDGGGATTHYGLRDEQFAMQWVKDNIAGFGGDPNNVTIFGESTGATDVLFHIISPAAKGLFHRAILHSPARYFNPLTSLADAESKGKAFAAAAGCPDQTAECLRKLPVDKILATQGSFGDACCATLPVNDGHILTSTIKDAIRSGQFHRVPILALTTHDENRWFQAFFGEASGGSVIKPEEYSKKLAETYADNAKAVEEAYPLKDFDSPGGALGTVSGDRGAICQPRNFNIDASKYVPVFATEFNDPNSPGILPVVSFPLLASHTHEIQYIFPGWKGAYKGRVAAFTPEQERLAKEMRRIWATFAEKGTLLPEFPPVARGNDPVISLEPSGIRVINNFAKSHRCELWDSIRNWNPVE